MRNHQWIYEIKNRGKEESTLIKRLAEKKWCEGVFGEGVVQELGVKKPWVCSKERIRAQKGMVNGGWEGAEKDIKVEGISNHQEEDGKSQTIL